VRRLLALLALSLAVPATAAGDSLLPLAHRVDLSHATAPAELPDLGARPRIPDWLKFSERRGGAHAADHWTGMDVKEEQYRDERGYVLTLATDNAAVDLAPFANLLASTYHYGEIELVHVFVTDEANLTRLCGATAAACYAADDPGKTRTGVMVVSYEDDNITHAVIHEYGHHVDNNTYNLGRLSDCGISGDGSRRWFFARDMQDRILDQLSCDPRGDWGRLLPEVYAEDYAQMVGIPRSEYHPAIKVPPPTAREKSQLRADLDSPFTPSTRKLKGRSSARGLKSFNVRLSLPVFLSARNTRGVRSVKTRGCDYQGFSNVFAGTCKVVVKTTKRRGRFSFNLLVY
jgi:hypothetical protein